MPPGHEAVESPHAGSVVDIKVREGAAVKAGDLLFVVSAMKMETLGRARPAPASSTSAGAARGRRHGRWRADPRRHQARGRRGQGSAAPCRRTRAGRRCSTRSRRCRRSPTSGWRPARTIPAWCASATAASSPAASASTCCSIRGSFREIGSLAGFATFDEAGDVAEFTPASHVGGQGRIEGRACIVCADDFTSRGGHADGAIGQKSRYLDRLSIELRTPSIRLLDGSSGGGSVATMVPKQDGSGEASAKESTGAIKAGRPRVVGGGGSFLPGHLGSTYYAEQLATVPVVNMLLGSVVGIGAAKAVLGHFSVMVRDISQLFVAGPPVVSHAMGYDVTKEDLGGWHIHCRNGSVDNLAESEEEAMAHDAPLPVLPAVERLRGAAGRERPPIPPIAARRSCSPWCRASARRPSTCGARSG